MTTTADRRSLEEAADRYLLEPDFGIPEVEAVMVKVFSKSRSGIEATAWTVYFRDLNIYEENIRDNMSDVGIAPKNKAKIKNLVNETANKKKRSPVSRGRGKVKEEEEEEVVVADGATGGGRRRRRGGGRRSNVEDVDGDEEEKRGGEAEMGSKEAEMGDREVKAEGREEEEEIGGSKELEAKKGGEEEEGEKGSCESTKKFGTNNTSSSFPPRSKQQQRVPPTKSPTHNTLNRFHFSVVVTDCQKYGVIGAYLVVHRSSQNRNCPSMTM
ncbi:hypothetical protein BYT27DRAFT_7254062 [Phlegmacium glaucopus]|nr:hypothetical protein BYT27DRAFT_7254062 [Phlegmacium glaucopus]